MNQEANKLSTSELAVLESLHGSKKAVSQREIAKRTGMSLGLINAVMKKLISTGYVKTSHLNRRSVDYLLTATGFAETAIRSYRYMLNTVRSYRNIQSQLNQIIDKLEGDSFSEYYLHGDGELAELVATFFNERGKGVLQRGLPVNDHSDGKRIVFNAVPELIESGDWHVVDLISELGSQVSMDTPDVRMGI